MGILICRFVWLATIHPIKEEENASEVMVDRGAIFDRNGNLLATQVEYNSLVAYPNYIENPLLLARSVSAVTGISEETLAGVFSNSDREYYLVKRYLSEEENKALRGLIRDSQFRKSTKFPHMKLIKDLKRDYPQKALASRLIGFASFREDEAGFADFHGAAGIEYSMDQALSPGERVNDNGVPVTDPFNLFDIAPPPSDQEKKQGLILGNNIYLTIDIETQYLLDKIAREAFVENTPDDLILILMDAKNGNILSYVAMPEYDMNNYQNLSIDELYRNIPLLKPIEPGSVFKIFTMASFLSLNAVTPEDYFDIGNVYQPPFFQRVNADPIRDVIPHEALSTTGILVYSSNVGMATISESVKDEDFYKKIRSFGFGAKTGIELRGENPGYVPTVDIWDVRTKPTLAFGHSISVSVLQIVSAATVFANAGTLLKPLVVKKIVSSDGSILRENSRQQVREVVPPEVAAEMLLMMEQVVASPMGTMHEAYLPYMRISGKSGTAQVFNNDTGEYDPNFVSSSVIAVFPTSEPRFIIYALFVNPKGVIRYGGRIGSPMIAKVIDALIRRYSIPLSGIPSTQHDGKFSPESFYQPEPPTIDSGIVPDFTGYTRKSFLKLLNNEMIKLDINGSGRVFLQYPPPGTTITNGMTIEVYLR